MKGKFVPWWDCAANICPTEVEHCHAENAQTSPDDVTLESGYPGAAERRPAAWWDCVTNFCAVEVEGCHDEAAIVQAFPDGAREVEAQKVSPSAQLRGPVTLTAASLPSHKEQDPSEVSPMPVCGSSGDKSHEPAQRLSRLSLQGDAHSLRKMPWQSRVYMGGQRLLGVLTLALTAALLGLPQFNCGLVGTCVVTEVQPAPADRAGLYRFNKEDFLLLQRLVYMSSLVGAVFSAPAAAVLQAQASTRYLWCVAGYASLVWLSMWSRAATAGLYCAGFDNSLTVGLNFIYRFSYPGVLLVSCVLVFHRVQALERTLLQPLGVARMRCALWLGLVLTLVWPPLAYTAGAEGPLHKLLSVLCWGVFSSLTGFFVLSLRALTCVLRSIREASCHAIGRSAMEASRASLTLERTRWGAIAGLVTALMASFSSAILYGWLWPLPSIPPSDVTWLMYLLCTSVSQTLDAVGNIFIAIALSGASRRTQPQEVLRRRRLHLSTRQYKPEGHAEWDAKVRELASRGLTLDALMRFYRGLGQAYMPWFQPSRHTTADVVRGAIIPLSREARSSLASVLMQNEPTTPQKMVTHTWSNLFRDLLAAIIADALEEEEYSKISYLIENDFALLEEWVREKGAMGCTYWVCAFSVNQHAGICSERNTRDSVTGNPHEPCSCGLPKVWSTTEPVLNDGRSVNCEMNKFHHMMLFLSAGSPTFEQVVAIDADFELFSRAWCVAEIAAAHNAGMRQLLKIENASSLERQEARLKQLRIEEMDASRPEDKAEILASIPDLSAFNSRLQSMLFEELFPVWLSFDAIEQMQHIARLARWGMTSYRRKSQGVWTE